MFIQRVFQSVVFVLTAASLVSAQSPKPDLILHHGKIVTVDTNFRIVEALAIKGDRILATGSNNEMLSLGAPGVQEIDLHGKTVLPGLIDSHLHAVPSSMYEFDHPVPTMETLDDVLNYIKTRADALPKGAWVELAQVFITRLKEQRYPTRAELDRVASENPVVFSTGPDASLNSLALKLSGIDSSFKVPEGVPCGAQPANG